MSDNSEKAEELLQQSKEQKRHTSDPKQSSEESASLQDAVADAYGRLEQGEMHENLTVRDGDLATLMVALDEVDQLIAVGEAALDEIDNDDINPETRAGVLKALLRVGLQEVAAEEFAAAERGKKQFAKAKADDVGI